MGGLRFVDMTGEQSLPLWQYIVFLFLLWLKEAVRMKVLGCKFRQNSGRNFDSVPDSSFLGAGMLRLRFRRSPSF
jgi:hypothetical protein